MRIVVIGAVLLAGVAGIVACSESESVVVKNETTRTIVVYEDGQPTTLIGPGVSRTFEIGDFRGTLTYEVRYFCDETECSQAVLAERTLTWEEMKQAGGVTLTVEPLAIGER